MFEIKKLTDLRCNKLDLTLFQIMSQSKLLVVVRQKWGGWTVLQIPHLKVRDSEQVTSTTIFHHKDSYFLVQCGQNGKKFLVQRKRRFACTSWKEGAKDWVLCVKRKCAKMFLLVSFQPTHFCPFWKMVYI